MTKTKRTFVVTIESNDDSLGQLEQCLNEELKGDFIKSFKITDLDEKIKSVEQEHRDFLKMRLEQNEYAFDGFFDEDDTIDEKIDSIMDLDWDMTIEESCVYEHAQRDTLRGLTY